jgi:hypothetical protein
MNLTETALKKVVMPGEITRGAKVKALDKSKDLHPLPFGKRNFPAQASGKYSISPVRA